MREKIKGPILMSRKGIVLAGGFGSRLYPMTQDTSKHLLAVYDKPMIYYPVSTLMMAGIKEILIITMERDLPAYQKLFGDGRQWGIQFEYAIQNEPKGLAEAFLVGEQFLEGSPAALILGDNVFYGPGMHKQLQAVSAKIHGATIFAYKVKDPRRYGVVSFDEKGQVVHIEEKPESPRSPYAIPGLYFFDNEVVEIAKYLTPSARGELEITDIHNAYKDKNNLSVEVLPRGVAWFDSGTPASLLQTSMFIETVEERQGIKVGSPEEVALRMSYINKQQLSDHLRSVKGCGYKRYLEELLEEGAL